MPHRRGRAVHHARRLTLARCFFARWHEIAHRLTTHADRGATEPAYRSEHDPLERLMDEIAGHVGFYGPVFDPVFDAAHDGKALLTFGTVEAVRAGCCPEASFQATLNACAKRLPTPLVYLEAALGYKKEERRRNQTPSLFGDAPPPGELRAVKVIPNGAAQQEGFTIPTNMRVPAASVIRRLFDADHPAGGDALEDLSQWESRGKTLEQRAVAVEGRKLADRVIAIVQPVTGKGQKPLERRSSPLFSVVEDAPCESGVRVEGRQ